LTVGSHNLFSRKLSGAFPNWEMVLPKDLAFVAEISTEDFRRSLSRVTLTADERNYSVTMEIEQGRLLLKSGSGAAEAEAQEEMMAVLSGGGGGGSSGRDVYSLRFNSRYVQDFLQVITKTESATFSLAFNDGNSPFELFLPMEREGFRYVLMPLRGE
jgi:DNA polymerase-3 subunit beta